jgi:hypothetical protein
VPDNVSISYRGATYALGQGPQFYGIWYATALQSQPLEWWPLTPEGWTAAWSRFASVEAPGTIRAVPPPVAPMTGPAGPVAGYRPTAGQQASWPAPTAADPGRLSRNALLSAALVGLGLVLGVLGLFPVYTGGASLASQSVNLVPHVIYLAAWAASAVLILLGGVRLRAGALLGLGVSAVTLGLFVADAGMPTATGAHGSGLVLSILGWVGCTAGVVLAAVTGLAVRRGLAAARGLAGRFGSQPSHDIVPLVTLMLAALGAAIAFAPSWDSFTLRTAAGASQTVTAGNAFDNAGAVIAGDVLTMIALVAVVVVAALWRPLRLGAALALGAAIPMVAEAISAVVQISEPASPLQFAIPPGEAARLGLTISGGLTPMFWVFCAFLGTLILLCAWMLLAHGQAADGPVIPGGNLPSGHAPGAYVPGAYVPGGYVPGASFPSGHQPGGSVPAVPPAGSGGDGGAAAAAAGTSGAAAAGGAAATAAGTSGAAAAGGAVAAGGPGPGLP